MSILYTYMQMRIILKKITILFCMGFLSAGALFACSAPNANITDQFTILTSFYPMYIHAINIAKGISDVKVINLTLPQTGCLHDYSLTTKDMKAFENASVLVVNGFGLESFLDKVIKQYPNLPIINASTEVDTQSDLDPKEDVNPHVWVSVTLAMAQVREIGHQLSKLDPEHAERYSLNTEAYVEKLNDLKKSMHQSLDSLHKPPIITFHEAFDYFAREFHLTIAAVLEREPGSEPSAKELKELIQLIWDQQIPLLFVEPQYPQRIAQIIVNETGIGIFTLDPAVTGPDSPDAYLQIMEANKETLVKALSGS